MTPAEFIEDPNWWTFLPELRENVRRLPYIPHEDCSPLDILGAASHLMKGGTLGSMPGYEERPGQLDMLRAVANAFNSREHLMIEAGTGVGKSLAYLIPAVLWSAVNDTPVVISTATRNLQSQLLTSDIPRAVKVVQKPVKVALLKGRSNYLCLRALGEYFASGWWTLPEEEKPLVPGLISWLQQTSDGDLDTYEGLRREYLTCPGEDCGGRKCPYYRRCFIYRARYNAATAHIILANHSLVLAEACAGTSSILPAYGRLVLDEAHNLEQIATEQFSYEFSVRTLRQHLKRLYRQLKDRDFLALGARATKAAERLMDTARGMLDVAPQGSEDRPRGVRYRVENGVRSYALNRLFKPYTEEEFSEKALRTAQDRFEAALAAIVNRIMARLENEQNEELAVRLGGINLSLQDYMNEVNTVLQAEKEGYAYWCETERLVGAPLTVAPQLKALLYDHKDSVILSSATLRVRTDFRYMIRRLGCEERFQTLTATSPFDYFRQSLVLAADYLPDPAVKPRAYAQALAALLPKLFAETNGRALVLFTSYEMMHEVASLFSASTSSLHLRLRLLVQSPGISREAMAAALRNATAEAPVVLFGAQSFWEGVDIAGAALSCVVIARLPFAQVGDPIVEARADAIDRAGGSSFRDYMLPEAVIRFRQGFGRLIRTKKDRGVVVVTDSRITTRSYGAMFRQAIPATVHTVTDEEDLLTRVRDFGII